MASDLSTTLREGSEEGFDTYCSPCFNNGISKEAEKFCVDCCVNYCEPCLKTHNQFPLLQGHQTVDKSGQGVRSAPTALPTEQCMIHQGKLADMFCTDHDAVCCAACIAISHSVKVDYLPDVAKGIKTSKEYRDVNNNLDEMLNKLNKEKTKRLENLSSLEKEKDKADEEITRVEEELKKKVTELAQKARSELQAKYNEGRKTIEGYISNVESVITKVTSSKNNLKSGNDAQLFLNIKGGKHITKDAQTLLSSLLKSGKKKCLMYVPNKDLQQLAQQMNLLGTIYIKDEESEEGLAEVREYTAKLQGRFKVNDRYCCVTSVCILDDTSILICISYTVEINKFLWKRQETNRYLKRLNMTDFMMVDKLQIEDESFSVCRTGSQEVAVALLNKNKKDFVSLKGNLTLTRSFSTSHICRGVAYNEITGELFVSNNDKQVYVYDKTGNMLNSYFIDNKGKQRFSQSKNIALNADPNALFITDWDNGLIALDKSSYLWWTFSDKELRNACGVCVLPGDVILVSGYYSNNVLQVDKHGKKLGTLLDDGDNLNNPRALAYHHNTSSLIVGQNSNEINIYTLCHK